MGLRVSHRSIYGLRALLDLAQQQNNAAVSVKVIAERQQIPARFLEQIFRDLRRAGLVQARRGPKGGFQLVGLPTDVPISRVLRALERRKNEQPQRPPALEDLPLGSPANEELIQGSYPVASSGGYGACLLYLDEGALGDFHRGNGKAVDLLFEELAQKIETVFEGVSLQDLVERSIAAQKPPRNYNYMI